MSRLKRLIVELQHRRVYRVAVAYAAGAFVIWQAADFALPALRLPVWVPTLVVVLTIVGFPIALVLAWVFDITPEGVRRTEPLAPGFEAPIPRRPAVLLAASTVLVIAIAGGWLLLRALLAPEEYSVPNPRRSMVILPFAVTAPDTSLHWLAEGAAEMLRANLEGWQELRVEDPRRLLTLARSRGISLDKPVDLGDGLTLARDALVGTLLLGEVIGYNDSVEIVVRMYDVETGQTIRAPERASGSRADPRPSMDSIAAQILEISGAPVVSPNIRVATTNSLQAYQAYLRGLQHLYRWRLDEAVELFRTAVGHDSTFALAYYRLAVASAWLAEGSERPGELLGIAVRHADRLPWRTRQHILAFDAFESGDYTLARQMYRELIAVDSTDAEAWFFLGDLEYHDSELVRGEGGKWRPRSNLNVALRAFHTALELDANFHLGYGHLFDIYGYWDWPEQFRQPGDSELVSFRIAWRDSFVWVPGDSWVPTSDSVVAAMQDRAILLARRWSSAAPDEVRPYEVLRDLYMQRRDHESALREQAVVSSLTHEYEDRLKLATLYLANGVYDSAVVLTEEGLAALRDCRTDPTNVCPGFRRAYETVVNVLTARGQPLGALQLLGERGGYFTRYPQFGISIGTEERSAYETLLILGSCGANRPELRTALDRISGSWSEPHYSSEEVKWLAEHFSIGPALFLLGENAVREWYARLDSVPSSWQSYLALQADSSSAAARYLDKAVDQPQERSFDLYLLANVAQALDRDSLAVALYTRLDDSIAVSFGLSHSWGLLSLSYHQRAKSYEALGDTANAIRYFERFIEIWRDAEPDLQHYADESREGLARLQGTSGPS